MLFLETGSPAKPLSTKTHLVNMFLSALLWAFPPNIALHASNGTIKISRGSLVLWAKCFAVSARSNLSLAKHESLIQADLYHVVSSFFRIGLRLPSNTTLSCSFSRGVLTAPVFVLHPDSLMMSGACLKSGSLSRYCPVLELQL